LSLLFSSFAQRKSIVLFGFDPGTVLPYCGEVSRKWGMIEQGGTQFQELVGRLIMLMYPNARVFDRPGKDGGFDCISEDRTIVYQAKDIRNVHDFHRAVRDEVKCIVRRKKDKEDGNHERWSPVTQWTCIASLELNDTDQSKFDKATKSLEDVGVHAALWHRADLNGFIDRFPGFENIFLSRQPALAFETLSRFVERQQEERAKRSVTGSGYEPRHADRVSAFLDGTIQCLLVNGAPGVGKTRFITELAKQAATQASVAVFQRDARAAHLTSMFAVGVPRILVIDELDHVEELQSVVANRPDVRVIASARAEAMLSADRFPRESRDRVDSVALKPLTR
jgi:hypothetical protein